MNLNIIAENFCNQLIALQNHIATRTDNAHLPTMQEVNMQVRLLNAIDKITKTIARQEKEAKRNDQPTEVSVKKATEMPLMPPAPQHGDPQPFSNGVFEEYRSILREYGYINSDEETIFVRGTEVNTWWFVYSLFQYCQPAEKRCYINDIDVFFDTVDLQDLKRQIAAFLDLVEAA